MGLLGNRRAQKPRKNFAVWVAIFPGKDYNNNKFIRSFRGRVKVPTGGKARERGCHTGSHAGSGEIPEPTV